MTDQKASALTAASALTGTELWAIVQGGADRKATAAQIAAYVALRCGYVAHQSAVNSAVTGTTTETTLATFTIPANSIGPNGSVDILTLFGYTNSANAKYLRIKINGTLIFSITPTTTASAQLLFSLANRNSAASQVANATGLTGIGSATGAEQTFTFDTTADLTVTITAQLSMTGEEIRLARRRCTIFPGA